MVHYIRLQYQHELIEKVKDRGHDFWVGAVAKMDHYEAMCRLGSVAVEELKAEDVFTHCYTLISNDMNTCANELIEKFGLGLRRKKLPTTKATKGCVYLMVNYSRETVIHARRSKITNDSTTFRLSSEAKLRNTTIIFEECTRSKILSILKRTKAFWVSSFSKLTVKESQKQIMNTMIEGQSPEKLFSHCYIMPSENNKKDCDQLFSLFGHGVRQNKVRAKETWGTVYALVATRSARSQNVGDAELAPMKDAPSENSGSTPKKVNAIEAVSPMSGLKTATTAAPKSAPIGSKHTSNIKTVIKTTQRKR